MVDEVRFAGVPVAMGGGTVVTEVAVGLSRGGRPAALRAAACMASFHCIIDVNDEKSMKLDKIARLT